MKNTKLTCKKSLFKSTYKSNAFDKGESYLCIYDSDQFVRIIDNQGHEFDFSKKEDYPYYTLSDYFITP